MNASANLKNLNTPQLTEEESNLCEGSLTFQECYDALKLMKDGKSPGNDGLTKEFYLCRFDKLGPLLRNSLNFSLEKGELSASQKQVVTTLIERKDRDRQFIKNWRPVSYSNVDLKIAPKALAGRLKKVIGRIIEPDQTAYIKDWNIHESTRLIQDMLDHTVKREFYLQLISKKHSTQLTIISCLRF